MNSNFLDITNEIISKSSHSDKFKKIDCVILVTGAKCNFSCNYCFINSCKYESNPKLINFESLAQALSIFKIKDSLAISIWAGEPLYNKKELINLCNFINKELPQAKISINTNGSLLNDWWADFFNDHKIYINVSHDGPGQKYRGFDFLESDSHIKALQKVQTYGKLNTVNTVIHKYNSSFEELYTFFMKMQDRTGINPTDYNFAFVLPDLNGHIAYNFDFMDNALIEYVYKNIAFLLKNGLNQNYNNIFPGMHQEILGFLKRMIFKQYKVCTPEAFMLDSCGQKVCTRSFFNKEKDFSIRENHLNRCLTCEKNILCPLASCQAIAISDETCNKIKNEILVIESILNNILENYETLYKI